VRGGVRLVRGGLGAFRGGVCGGVRSCYHVAGGFGGPAAAGAKLTALAKSVEGLCVW